MVGWLLHFGLSVGGFVGLYAWAGGVQDAGTPAPALGWLEAGLRFVLLQPLAHWVLDAVPIAWWTWSGLAAVSLLFGLNSLVAVALIGVALRASRIALRGSRSRIEATRRRG